MDYTTAEWALANWTFTARRIADDLAVAEKWGMVDAMTEIEQEAAQALDDLRESLITPHVVVDRLNGWKDAMTTLGIFPVTADEVEEGARLRQEAFETGRFPRSFVTCVGGERSGGRRTRGYWLDVPISRRAMVGMTRGVDAAALAHWQAQPRTQIGRRCLRLVARDIEAARAGAVRDSLPYITTALFIDLKEQQPFYLTEAGTVDLA